jgi:hypothetical protein
LWGLPPVAGISTLCFIIAMRSKSTMFWLAAVLASIGASATADGTTIVVGFSKDKVVIAAESRAGDEDRLYNDNACKITALNDRLLFTVSGRYIDRTHGVLGWDAAEQAKTAFSRVSKLPLEFYLAVDVASIWQELLAQNISDHIRATELASLEPNRIYVDGWFLGLSPMGNIQAAYARIATLAGVYPPRLYSPPVVEGEVLDAMRFTVQGEGRAQFVEFLNDTSARAKAERSNTIRLSRTWPPEEADARMAMRLVELLVKYADHPEDVGGPVDAVELKKSGTIHWIQRKPNCKDQ